MFRTMVSQVDLGYLFTTFFDMNFHLNTYSILYSFQARDYVRPYLSKLSSSVISLTASQGSGMRFGRYASWIEWRASHYGTLVGKWICICNNRIIIIDKWNQGQWGMQNGNLGVQAGLQVASQTYYISILSLVTLFWHRITLRYTSDFILLIKNSSVVSPEIDTQAWIPNYTLILRTS
jgi:hypothetical protein